jgi:nicotinamidase-related amidase
MPPDTLAKPRWFTRDTAALVLIDHQIGTLQLIKNIASDAALRNAVALAKAAKTLGMPIVMTASMEDHVQGPLAPALQLVAPDAYKLHVKRLGIVNAWADPNFKAAVAATGRKHCDGRSDHRYLPDLSQHQRRERRL